MGRPTFCNYLIFFGLGTIFVKTTGFDMIVAPRCKTMQNHMKIATKINISPKCVEFCKFNEFGRGRTCPRGQVLVNRVGFPSLFFRKRVFPFSNCFYDVSICLMRLGLGFDLGMIRLFFVIRNCWGFVKIV